VAEPTSLRIRARNEDADPSIALTDANGATLAENDDADGYNSRIDLETPLSAGTYCLAVEALSDASLPIEVIVETVSAEDIQRGRYDSGEVSPPLDGSYPVAELGTLSTDLGQQLTLGAAHQWFVFDLNASGLVVFDAVGVDTDTTLALYDALGRPLGTNDDGPSGTDAQLVHRLTAGRYVLAVGKLDDDAGFARLVMERYVPAQ